MIPESNKFYRHRYGGIYTVTVPKAKSTEDKSEWVAYTHVWPFAPETWIRPYDEWCDGRFQELAPGEYLQIIKQDKEAYKASIVAAKEAAKSPQEGDTKLVDGKVADFQNGKWVKVQG